MATPTISAVEVRVLSRMLERAQGLSPEALEAWIATLPEAQHALVPRLRERLAQIAGAAAAPAAPAAPPRLEPVRQRDPRHGERVGPYRLLHELGTPGPGLMWQAERAEGSAAARRPVALMLTNDPGAAERQLAALPAHPNIARLQDAGVDRLGRAWRVMPWVGGVPMAEHAQRRRPNPAQRVRLALQVCDALALAHAEHVAHGDIRPANVRVDDEGRVTLLDWGNGRLLHPASAAADIQALGGVLQGLFAGSGPGADLRAVLQRTLADAPGQRYAGVGELIDDLQRVLQHRPVAGAHATPLHRASLFVRRRRAELAAAALGLLLLVAAVAMGLRQHQQGQAQSGRAERVREFLQQALPADAQSADPALQGPLVQRALEQTRAGFAGQPELRGQVLTELGVRFRDLQQPEQALTVLREAQSLLQGTAAAGDPALARANAELAWQLQHDGGAGAAQAGALAQQALAACASGGEGCDRTSERAREVLQRTPRAAP